MNVAEIRMNTKPDPEFQIFSKPAYEKINEWGS
jgi:hypothetical protein